MPRKAAITLICITILLGFSVWIAAREATLIWVVNQAAQRAGGKVLASGVTGSLLYGPIGFGQIQYRSPGLDITAERGRIELERWSLFSRKAMLRRVDIDSIIVTQHPAANAEPARLPEQLQLPFELAIDELRVNRIMLGAGKQPTLGPVIASVQLQSQQWSAQVKSMRTIAGTATAQTHLATARPFSVNGSLSLVQDAPVYQANGQITGTLARIVWQADAVAKDARARANGTITPLASGPIEHLDVQASGIDPHYFHPSAPGASFGLTLTADRDADGKTMKGALAVTNATPGSLDIGRVPVTKLAGKVTGVPTDFAVTNLLLDLGAAGTLAGGGRVRDGKLDLDLVTRSLNLNRLHGRLHPTELAGTIQAKASQDQQRFLMELTQKDGRIEVSASLRNGELTVQRMRASAAGGSIDAHGQLHLEGDQPLAFKGTVTNFDPSRFGSYRRARINSRFDATGSLAPILQLHADLDVFDSQINGVAAAGRIRWRSKGTQTPDVGVDLAADVGNTHARAKGTLFDPVHLSKLNIQLALEGQDLSDLFPILGLPLPPTPPYKLTGHLIHHDDLWSFQQFSGKVGESDLAGDFVVDRSGSVQVVRANLVSDTLRLADLAGFIGARGDDKRATEQTVLPNEAFNLDKLRAAEADVRFTGRRIVTRGVPIDHMSAHLKLARGILTIDPLDFGVAGGNVVGIVRLDATQPVIAGNANLQVKSLHLERLVPKAKSAKASVGTMQGRAQLSGTGNSVAALLGTSHGNVTVLMDGGEISNLALRLMNLDVAHALVALMRGDQSIPVRCMVGHFVANRGHLKPQPFVLDTEHTKVVMGGDIDLGMERLNLRLIAEPKDVSLVALRGPILVEGPFSSPSVRPDLKRAIARSAAAIALGVVATPVAALVPLFELGTEKDANCQAIMTQAQAIIHAEPGARPPTPDTTEAAGPSRKGGG